MSLSCASCRSAVAADARFCPSCGTPAAASTPAAPADPVREILKVALGRQYDIRQLLGKGGMGAVYLATEAALEREVAIKVLPPDRGATKDSRDRFRREARTAAKLSHPNIVPLYTFGDVDGTLYFVMGYVKGESLAARLKREGPLPVEDSRRILIELCDALDYAHKLGVIHRDIKPDNVLLEESTGRALLTDFGVAKALGAGQTMTEVGSVIGTPQYMSPEQAQGKADIDHRTDIYSLGVMGYAMLAGRLPFEGGTPGDIMVQHITKEAPALGSLLPDLPIEVASALTRCLAKDRDRRFRDGASLKLAVAPPKEGDTPPQLDGLEGFIIYPALGGFLLLCLAAWRLGDGDTSSPLFVAFQLALVAGSCIPLLLAPARFHYLRKAGFQSAEISRAVLRPLNRLSGWLPRHLRRAGDVWDRLPGELRRVRLALDFLVLSAISAAPLFIFSVASASAFSRTGRYPFVAPSVLVQGWIVVMGGLLAASFPLMFQFQRLRRRLGLDSFTANSLLGADTANVTLWSKPEIAALLSPAESVERQNAGAETSAPELARAIEELCGSRGSQSIANEAARAARALAAAIATRDAEIAAIASNADPAERGRLEGRLASLGPALADEDEARRRMRELVQKQLDLLREFESRLKGLQDGRAQHIELLRALWRQAVDLRAAAVDSGIEAPLAGRIRALCAEITRQVDDRGTAPTAAISDSPTLER